MYYILAYYKVEFNTCTVSLGFGLLKLYGYKSMQYYDTVVVIKMKSVE